jgi:DNA polymerase III delta prime subunit
MPSVEFQNSKPLITRYRPTSFAEVVGNTRLVQSLAAAVREQSCPHGFLFTGIPGIGKTTLARIVAKEVDATIYEVNAAMNSGVDDTRQIVEASGYASIMLKSARLFLIDEAANLSQKAWQPLLKLIEDPPPGVFVAFCTTDPTNIPDMIKSRCFTVALQRLTSPELRHYILDIADREGWIIHPDVLGPMVTAANGSARMALAILQEGHAAQSRTELAQIIELHGQNPEPEVLHNLSIGGKGRFETIRLKDLEPIPERDLAIDPVDPSQVERLKDSIRESGFWGGVVCCRIEGKLYVAAGWQRVTAAIHVGEDQATVFVGNFDVRERIRVYGSENATQRGNRGSAPTGVVAAAIRLLAKELLTTPTLSFLKERPPHSLNQLVFQMSKGNLGEPIITEFLANIPQISSMSVQQQIANLKTSGEYGRIMRDVGAEINVEHAAELDRLRTTEAEATREELDRIENAAKRAQEAVAAAQAIKPTFDLEGVSQHLRVESHVTAFRKLAYDFRASLPLDKQADVARELVMLYPGRSLTVKMIRAHFAPLVEAVQQGEKQFTPQEKEALAQRDRARAFESLVKEFMSDAKNMAAVGEKIGETLRDWRVGETIPWPAEFFSILKLVIDTLNKVYEKGKGSLKYLPKAS